LKNRGGTLARTLAPVMNASSPATAQPPFQLRVLPAIMWGGLIAGTFDISDALVITCLIRGRPAMRLFQYIAQGLIGPGAFDGGMGTAALGLGLHYFIAYGAAVFFVLLSCKVPALFRRPFLWGPVYGVGFYFFMNYVVLPLSATPPFKVAWPIFINGVAIHALGIGLPIALCTRWWARPAKTAADGR
jgi:hypothetical protein